MSVSTWQDPVDYRTGDILGAAHLNALLTNLDILSGLQRLREAPLESSAYPNQCYQEYLTPGNEDYGCLWRGWWITNGEFLSLKLSGDGQASVWIGNPPSLPMAKAVDGLAGGSTYNILLPAVHSERGQVRRIDIIKANPTANDTLTVDYVYSYSSTPSQSSGPAFANGTVSAASDFNTIHQSMRNLWSFAKQPIIGVRGCPDTAPYSLRENEPNTYPHPIYGPGKWPIFQRWWTEHRGHSRIAVNYIMRSPNVDRSEQYELTFRARLQAYYNTVQATLWEKSLNTSRPAVDIKGPEIVDVSAALASLGVTLGAKFKVQLEMCLYDKNNPQRNGGDDQHMLRFDYWWQVGDDQLTSWTTTTRWTHGTPGYGDSGGPPQLDTLTDNLALLNNRRRWLNPIQREPMFAHDPVRNPWEWRYYQARVWRWLSWRSYYDLSEHGAEGSETPPPKPVLYYNNGKDKTWQAYDLPGDLDTHYLLDLDTTPILPGMVFYAYGCRYAIQQPEPY